MAEPVITVEALEKLYRVWAHEKPTSLKERLRLVGATARARVRLRDTEGLRRDVWALRGVSFDVGRGEVLGVIGRNGAGKSTLLSILARITEPTRGSAVIRGRVSSLLEVGTGFHPELTGRDNVFLNGAILGMTRTETARKFDEIVEFAGVRDFIDIPVKRYSSGMQVRLAFAVAAHLDPEVLLLDEVLAVGDASFQARCHARVEEMTRSGRTVLFVSHDVNSVARLCNSAIVLHEGEIAFSGAADDAVDHYLREQRPAHAGPDDPAREGSGEARVRRVDITDAHGETRVTAGGPIRFAVDLDVRTKVPLAELRVSLLIKSTTGGTALVLSTDYSSDSSLPSMPVNGHVTLACEADVLPLRPGSYVVSAVVERHAHLLDRIENAGGFVMLAGDVFGNASVPTNYPAPVVVRHRWELDSATSPAAEQPLADALPR